MTNTTQCPACQTRFKVSDAQLAAANGLVRCGRCAHVFNARDHFQVPVVRQTATAATPQPAVSRPPLPEQPRPEIPPPEAKPAAAQAQPLMQPPVSEIDDFELEVPDFDPLTAHLPSSPLPEYPEDEMKSDAVVGPSLEDVEAFQQALNQALQNRPASAPIGNPFDELEREIRPAPAQDKSFATAAAVEEDVPAIFDTRRTATPQREEPQTEEPGLPPPPEAPYDPAIGSPHPKRPRNPLVMTLIAVVSLIGLLLLAAQLVYVNRTLIASQAPELRPALEKICRQLHCTVPLPTDQEFIRTEWSELSFVPEHANLIQLSATLKNHAAYPQAFPMLEVTLKDANNLVVIRKVFTPAEYLKQTHLASQGFAGNSEVKITMRFDVGTVHAQGYSLLWFYP